MWPALDDVTPPDGKRFALGALALALPILILLPLPGAFDGPTVDAGAGIVVADSAADPRPFCGLPAGEVLARMKGRLETSIGSSACNPRWPLDNGDAEAWSKARHNSELRTQKSELDCELRFLVRSSELKFTERARFTSLQHGRRRYRSLCRPSPGSSGTRASPARFHGRLRSVLP
jgi:hypothetical protein